MSDTSDSHRLCVHNATVHDQVAGFYDQNHVEILNPVQQERVPRPVADILSLLGLRAPQVLDVRPGPGNSSLKFDHEASDRAWLNDPVLDEYQALTKLSAPQHLRDLVRTGEAFTLAFAKAVFMKMFVNCRYEREGETHAWPDDNTEGITVGAVLAQKRAPIVRTQEHLHYRPRGSRPNYDRYRYRCSDMQCVVARKHG